jgi:hypothetical protein
MVPTDITTRIIGNDDNQWLGPPLQIQQPLITIVLDTAVLWATSLSLAMGIIRQLC